MPLLYFTETKIPIYIKNLVAKAKRMLKKDYNLKVCPIISRPQRDREKKGDDKRRRQKRPDNEGEPVYPSIVTHTKKRSQTQDKPYYTMYRSLERSSYRSLVVRAQLVIRH